jgi:hypothetical protein
VEHCARLERPIQARPARPAACTVTKPPKGDFRRLSARCHEAVSGKQSLVSPAVPNPYMCMHICM